MELSDSLFLYGVKELFPKRSTEDRLVAGEGGEGGFF